MIARSSFLSSIMSAFDGHNIPDHLIDSSWNGLLVYVNSEKMVVWNHMSINHSYLTAL